MKHLRKNLSDYMISKQINYPKPDYMKKHLLMTALAIMSAFVLVAQKSTLENVYKLSMRNSGVIKEGTEVKGYFLFFASDKIDKNSNEYTLQIIDNNLKKLKEIKFVDSKHVSILESSFNGTDLIFLLYNDDENTFEYQVYGADGKKKYTYNRILTKKEDRYLKMTYLANNGDDEDTYKGIYPIEGLGFISNMPSREDKDYTFQLDFFSTQKRKQWTYIPTLGGKKFIGDYLGTANDVVYISILKYSGAFDKKPESVIVGLSLENGKQLFEVSTESKQLLYPSSMFTLADGKSYLFGEYFDPNGNIAKDKSVGFAFWSMNEKGKIESEKYCSWSLDMSKFLDVTAKGKIDDFGFMFLHNMVQAADGSIYAIGEGYKKVGSALGIAAKVLSAGRTSMSTTKMKITDMILLNFDKDFNIKGAKIYEKNSNNIMIPDGMDFSSTPMLGKMIKYNFGGFDYSYTQVNKDATSFTVCYSDYERSKDYKGSTFNAITYTDGKITTDKINTKSDATNSTILPAPQGQILILDYYKKAKRLDLHIEKLN